jgi:anti-sigma factor RsiW
VKCREVVSLVTEYLENSLPPDQRRRFEEHLRGCKNCTEYLAEMRTTLRLMGRLEPDRLPDHMRRDLVQAFKNWRAR